MPPSVEYCKVDPTGQDPAGADIEPPEGLPPKTVHVLFTTTAAGAAAVSIGQAAGQAGVAPAPVNGIQVLLATPLATL